MLLQVSWRDVARTVAKEAQAGLLMGALLGALVFGVTFVWPAVSSEVSVRAHDSNGAAAQN